jgi:hypothetical protein
VAARRAARAPGRARRSRRSGSSEWQRAQQRARTRVGPRSSATGPLPVAPGHAHAERLCREAAPPEADLRPGLCRAPSARPGSPVLAAQASPCSLRGASREGADIASRRRRWRAVEAAPGHAPGARLGRPHRPPWRRERCASQRRDRLLPTRLRSLIRSLTRTPPRPHGTQAIPGSRRPLRTVPPNPWSRRVERSHQWRRPTGC